MTFRVGQKVVKYRQKAGVADPRIPKIPIGTELTIRDVDHRAVFFHGVPTLRFEGVIGPMEDTIIGEWEVGYHPRNFRPIVEKKTSIAVFEEILRRETVEDGERVS